MNKREILEYALGYAYQQLSFCASNIKEYPIALGKCLELKALMEEERPEMKRLYRRVRK